MVNNSFTWYVLYTKPRWEKKVAEQLSKKQVENYCPLNRVVRNWSDRKKIVHEPLFKSYVFVRIPEIKQSEIRLTLGVINFVYWLRKPAIVKDSEIEIIRRFMNDHDNVQLERLEVGINDQVKINAGPLMHREGNVIELRQKTVRVKLSSLGFALIAEIDKAHIEKINFVNRQNGGVYMASQSAKFNTGNL
jgi:transcription antitermination factor NusG